MSSRARIRRTGTQSGGEIREQQPRSICPLPHHKDPDRPRGSYEAAGTILCGGHVRGLDADLDRLPGLHVTLAAAHLSSGISLGYASRSADTPLPIKSKISAHRYWIRDIVASWAFNVADERKLTPPDVTVPDIVRFLRRHLDWIITRYWVIDIADEIAGLRATAVRLAYPDWDAQRTRIPCPEIFCDGMLFTPTRRDPAPDDDKLPEALICDTCAIGVPPGAWRTLAKNVHRMSGLVTEEAALLWAVAEGRRLSGPQLRQWASRGQVTRHEQGARVLYDLDEIEARLAVKLTRQAS